MVQYPSVKKEVVAIEAALIQLSEATAGDKVSPKVWERIIQFTQGVTPHDNQVRKRNWGSITGWAAALLILCRLGIYVETEFRFERITCVR